MPLLQYGQDPNGLAARVAFHLHLHGISIRQLNRGGISFDIARQLRQATLQLSPQFVSQIAAAVQLEPADLDAPLTDQQMREWEFYRISARQVTEVWRRVAEASTAANYSQRKLGALLEIDQSVINRVMRGERKSPVLNWHDAAKIADALELPEGVEAFISPKFSRENAPYKG